MAIVARIGTDVLLLSGSQNAHFGIASFVIGFFKSPKSQSAVHVTVALHLGPATSLVPRIVHDGYMIDAADLMYLSDAHLSHVQPTRDVPTLPVHLAAD